MLSFVYLADIKFYKFDEAKIMTLKQLKAFLVLARTKLCVNAADELCLSQSALSLSIKSLEDELGGKLFKRNTRQVNLTTEGHSLIPYAKNFWLTGRIWKKMLNNAFNYIVAP